MALAKLPRETEKHSLFTLGHNVPAKNESYVA